MTTGETIDIVDSGQVDELESTVKTCFQSSLFSPPRSGTTNVEGPHGQLGPRLANGLGSDNTDRFAKIDQVPPGQVSTITEGADAALAFTRQHRADFDLFNPGFLDFGHQVFIDQLIGFHQQIVSHRIKDIVQRNPDRESGLLTAR